jgi:hypothetical protein
MLIPIIISGALLLAAGCAPESAASPPEGSNDSEEDHVENSIQVLGEGIKDRMIVKKIMLKTRSKS